MGILNLSTWKFDNNLYTSPPLDNKMYEKIKKFMIRSWLHGEFDDKARIIKISIDSHAPSGKGNLEKLMHMKII